MPDIVHRGTCHNMILSFDDPRQYNNAVASVNGGRFEIVLRKEKTKRSDQANKYYWAVVVKIITAEFYGMATAADKDRVHEGLKRLFLLRHDAKTNLDYVESTTRLSTAEFQEYLTQCRKWAAEQGINVPEPNEVSYEQ
jgi:hypothetical protein